MGNTAAATKPSATEQGQWIASYTICVLRPQSTNKALLIFAVRCF